MMEVVSTTSKHFGFTWFGNKHFGITGVYPIGAMVLAFAEGNF